MTSKQDIETYFRKNYYGICPKSTSFFSSSNSVVYSLFGSNIYNVPLFILGGFCVLRKTPKSMSSMKWVYFNMHFWLVHCLNLL
ncbi:hypothetical protein CRE_02760 [Caenorhabditis remanei]|uniref:Uncharacterized protein n=1 Tax=Caenorhabditis remanei TaxID=31234 RepID=E3NS61_CAERE|nr:hypothetical protein CRE_02760 [Caenorhabditis remanei]